MLSGFTPKYSPIIPTHDVSLNTKLSIDTDFSIVSSVFSSVLLFLDLFLDLACLFCVFFLFSLISSTGAVASSLPSSEFENDSRARKRPSSSRLLSSLLPLPSFPSTKSLAWSTKYVGSTKSFIFSFSLTKTELLGLLSFSNLFGLLGEKYKL